MIRFAPLMLFVLLAACATAPTPPRPPAEIALERCGEWALPVMCVLRARTFADRVTVIDAFVRRVTVRFAQEGIEIPFPQRVVHLVQEKPV